MVASWYGTVRACGRIAGSFLVGGVILQQLEFFYTCLLYCSVMLVSSLIAIMILYLNGFYRKVYYTVQNKDYELHMSNSTVIKVAVPKQESLLESTLKRTMVSIEAI